MHDRESNYSNYLETLGLSKRLISRLIARVLRALREVFISMISMIYAPILNITTYIYVLKVA